MSGVHVHVGHAPIVELARKGRHRIVEQGGDEHAVGLHAEQRGGGTVERGAVVLVEREPFHPHVVGGQFGGGAVDAPGHGFPILPGFERGDNRHDMEMLLQRQRARHQVGAVAHLVEHRLYLAAVFSRHLAAVVYEAVHRARRHTRHAGDVDNAHRATRHRPAAGRGDAPVMPYIFCHVHVGVYSVANIMAIPLPCNRVCVHTT